MKGFILKCMNCGESIELQQACDSWQIEGDNPLIDAIISDDVKMLGFKCMVCGNKIKDDE